MVLILQAPAKNKINCVKVGGQKMVSPKTKQVVFSIAPLLHLVCLGAMLAYPGILIPALLKEQRDDIRIDQQSAHWIASVIAISGCAAVIVVSPLMDIYGRKITHIIITAVILTGWIMTAFAGSYTTLIIGRALQGICSSCVYFNSICIGELSSPSLRGILLTFKLIAASVGIILIHASGYFFHWRMLSLVGAVPCILSLAISIFWPDTPDWLASKGWFEESESVFFALRGRDEESEREIRKIIEGERRNLEYGEDEWSFTKLWSKIGSRVLWRPVLLHVCATIIPQAGGRMFFPSYSLQLAERITGSDSNAFIFTIVIDIIGIIATYVGSFLVKRFARRTLLLHCGVFGNIVLLFSCLLMLIRKQYYENEGIMWTSHSLFIFYFIVMDASTFIVSFILLGELFPLEFRAIGGIITSIVASVLMGVTMKVTPILKDMLDIHGMFFLYSMFMLAALAWMYYDLPETKDRTLHDVGEYFKGKSPKIRYDERLNSGGIDETVLLNKVM